MHVVSPYCCICNHIICACGNISDACDHIINACCHSPYACDIELGYISNRYDSDIIPCS